MSTAPAMSIRYGGRREIGYQRQENQDQIARFSSPRGEVFLLADGMGGHEGGAIAANMAITGFERHFLALAGQMPLNAALAEASRLVNADIHARGYATQTNGSPMGSTLALVVVQEGSFVVGHIGDSRVYLFRDGRLTQLTRDHTATQKMVDAGMLTPEQSRVHPDASVLTRALGQGDEMELDISEPYTLLSGDVLLLCSDGLSGYVQDGPIEERLRRSEDPQRAADALTELALEAGGLDNISVWVVRADREDPAPVPAPPAKPAETRESAPAASEAKSEKRKRKFAKIWLWFAVLAAVAAAGRFAWEVRSLRETVQRITGGAPAPGAAKAVSAGSKSASKAKAAPPAAPVGAVSSSLARGASDPGNVVETARIPAGTAAPQTAAQKAPVAEPEKSAPGGIRVMLVHLPAPDSAASKFIAGLAHRLQAAGFSAAARPIPDPKNEPAWRMAPKDVPAQERNIVVAVYQAGFEEQARRVCQAVQCAAAPRAVAPSDLKLFQSSFQGRQIAVFALLPPAGAKAPPR